jgi:transposase
VAYEYDEKYIADALNLVRRGDRSIAAIARDLGINDWKLRQWCRDEGVKKRHRVQPQAPSKKRLALRREQLGDQEDPQEKLKRLERENQRLQKENESLKMDREILKKAAAFFAKESE